MLVQWAGYKHIFTIFVLVNMLHNYTIHYNQCTYLILNSPGIYKCLSLTLYIIILFRVGVVNYSIHN